MPSSEVRAQCCAAAGVPRRTALVPTAQALVVSGGRAWLWVGSKAGPAATQVRAGAPLLACRTTRTELCRLPALLVASGRSQGVACGCLLSWWWRWFPQVAQAHASKLGAGQVEVVKDRLEPGLFMTQFPGDLRRAASLPFPGLQTASPGHLHAVAAAQGGGQLGGGLRLPPD